MTVLTKVVLPLFNTYYRLLNRQKAGARSRFEAKCGVDACTTIWLYSCTDRSTLTESSAPCTWWITTSWESQWQYQLGESLEREAACHSYINIATTTGTWVTNLQIQAQITNHTSMFSMFIVILIHPHISGKSRWWAARQEKSALFITHALLSLTRLLGNHTEGCTAIKMNKISL